MERLSGLDASFLYLETPTMQMQVAFVAICDTRNTHGGYSFPKLVERIESRVNREAAFRRYYHADTGQGIGERNALTGLASVGLFLEILGVRLISPRRVWIAGFNPFPLPVTVKYRGLTVLRQKEKTVVIFPDGQTATITDPAPQVVSCE